MNTTKLGYRGVVDVKLIIGNKRVVLSNHNEGEEALFKAFAKFLTGNSVDVIDTPQFLDLQYKSTDGDKWKSWLSKTVSLSGREYYYDGTNWIAKFSTAIAHSNLIQTITSDMDADGEFKLVMYSGTNDEITTPSDLAWLKVAAKDLARIVPGTQAIIEWSMMVDNK